MAIPVIAGLAVGIALIALFSIAAKLSFSMSDDEVKQKVRNLPEVQAFYERYTPLEQIKRIGTTTYVQYQISKTFTEEGIVPSRAGDIKFEASTTKELKLTVRIDSFDRTSMILSCGGPVSGELAATVDEIKTTRCVEHP